MKSLTSLNIDTALVAGLAVLLAGAASPASAKVLFVGASVGVLGEFNANWDGAPRDLTSSVVDKTVTATSLSSLLANPINAFVNATVTSTASYQFETITGSNSNTQTVLTDNTSKGKVTTTTTAPGPTTNTDKFGSAAQRRKPRRDRRRVRC